MRLMKSLAIVVTALALTACASGVLYKDMAASTPKVQADQGRIYFFRPFQVGGFAIQPPIQLDGVNVGSSKPDGFFYVDSTPGTHEVSTTADPEKKLSVTLGTGETKYVKTFPVFGSTSDNMILEIVSEADAMKVLPELGFTGATSW